MVTQPRDARQGSLSWAASLDLPGMPDRQRVAAAADLTTYRGLRHPDSRVKVIVGCLRPTDCDPRVEYFLTEALANGVNVHLQGEMHAVGSWWRALTEATAPRRHLQVVR